LLVVHNAEFGTENGETTGRKLHRFSPGTYAAMSMHLAWLIEGFVQTFSADLVRDFPLDHRLCTAPAPKTSAPLIVTHAHDSWIAYLANVVGEIRIIPETLAIYRRHSAALTSRYHHTLAQHFAVTFTNHGDRYRELGDWYRLAATVSDRLSSASDPAFQFLFRRATARALKEADFLHTRSRFWLESNFYGRAKALIRLIRTGAYLRSENFSKMAIFKDLLGLFVETRFRR
jgi:hypothetical protein